MAKLSVVRMLLYGAGSFGAGLVFALLNTGFSLYLIDYSLPNWLIAFLSQERSFIGGFVQPVVGVFSDRTRTRLGRRRPYFLVGVPLAAIALVLLAQQPPLLALLLIVPVFALLLMIAYDPYLALMVDITPAEQRGRMGSATAFCGMLGQVAFLALATTLWSHDQAFVFYVVAAGLVASFAVTFFGVPEPAEAFAPVVRAPAPPRRDGWPGSGALRWLRNVLSYRELAKYVASQCLFWFGMGAAVPFLTLFGVRELGLEEGTAFSLILVLVLLTALAAAPAGWLGDRFGKQRLISTGLLGLGLVIVVGSAAQTLEQILVVMVLAGIANAINTVLGFPLLADLMPRERAGEFSGLGSMVWSLAQPLGSLAGGLVADATGGYRAVFVLTGVMLLLSWLALQTVRAPRVVAAPAPRGEGGKSTST